MRTVVLTLGAALLLLVTQPAGASNAVSLGHSDETTIVGPERECSGGTLVHNHDGSFEYGYNWTYGGCQPPYYGAFGEGYDLGIGKIRCAAYWLAGFPGFGIAEPADCYVWNGGVTEEPGEVLAVITDVHFSGIANWPMVSQHDVDINVDVLGAFTIGYWANMQGGWDFYVCGADLDGPPGHPWTCIAPGIGFPSGWQDPSIVWGPTSAMGCGVYFESNPTPAESPTWGAIKEMFR